MSKTKNKAFLFQSLNGKFFKYLKKEQIIIDTLKPLTGGEWDGKIKVGCKVKRVDRDNLVINIKKKIEKLQGKHCIYCGLHENYCGPLEREHIAPKGKGSYPEFMFEPLNLVLACHHCNYDLKKEINTINKKSSDYSKCTFNIVHPYFDNIFDHIKFAVKNGQVLIKSAPYSRKGKAYIQLFQLDNVHKTEKRSGLLLVKEIKVLDKYDSILDIILSKKYLRS
ncbi:hypothetical protein CHRYSEOSP005_25420 [Chryseobacterium sp. Alg-005]|uniref:hypothetical protein n=1 Tax=Chryseobacterium sp. Alg-005 TaxID=3159516 RepID=UPI0035557246